MAGQPKKRALFTSIAAMAKIAAREANEDISGSDFIFQWWPKILSRALAIN